jgi:tetratricopeptide (TPR) repeat protein
VGREAELARLAEGLRRAQRGEGQVLLLSGEAGSGKTLLLQAFMQRHVVGALGAVAAWGACNAQMGDGDPYLPFREILRLLTGDFDVSTLRDCMTPALAQQLEALMPTVTAALQRFGPDLFGSLLPADRELAFAPDARSPRPSPLPAALCDQVERVFGAVARRCTLVLVLEDLHWADSSTLNLLTHLGRRLHQSRILLVGSYRSTEAPPALTRAIHELQRRRGDITLDLDQTAGRAFVDAVVDSSPNALTPTFREQLYRQTDGHALFTVALIEQLRAEGVLTYNAAGEWVAPEDLNWHYLPPQVEAVIAARVDDLSAAHQALLTAASVEGETFTADVMAQVLELTVDSVQQALSGPLHACQLVAAQGLERIGQRRVARYRFRHSLFQQYLYEQLDLVQRAQHHEAVGRALESLYADRPEAAAKLAYHFEAAGLLEEAVTYLTQAGAYAYRLSAPTEAIKLYRRGLKLVGQLPESVARDRQELALQMGLDMPLFAARGWGAPERAVALKRAHALARRLEAMPQLLFILRSLADVNTAQAEHRQSLVYAEQLAKMSQRSGNQAHEIISYRMVGISHFFLGHYQDARAWLEKGIRRAKTLRQKGMDPSALPEAEETAFLWGWLPIIFFVLGYPEQALATSREALARVQEQGHVHAQAKMLTVAGLAFHATIRQPEMALHYADELLVLATDHHLPAFKGWAIFYLGWARAALGQTEEGLSEMAAGWEQLRATGTEASLAYLLTLLTQAYMDAGHYQRSAEILTRALRIAEQTDARAYLAEMYRLRGELCLVHPEQARLEEAEPWFYKALELAQKQTARLWELRATVSLARLWKTQGRASDARARLAELYAGFTEGQDMPDLMEARTLLASL